MPGICTASTRDGGGDCGHFSLTVNLDGESVSFKTGFHDVRWGDALNTEEKRQMLALLARWWKSKGKNLASFVGHVLCGEEGSNVKIYNFFGPGAAITKTNIGTSYVNICNGLNGEPLVADFSGCTEYRVRLYANLVGTGQWGARIQQNGNTLHEAANLGAAGERALDTGWNALPAAFLSQGLLELVAQAKSTTGADDPVFRSMSLGLR